MSITLSRRVLPPGIEDDIVFGIMWIRVGALKISKPSPTQTNKVRIQFWGESSPAILCPSSSQPQTQEYDIKCPVTFFDKYIADMKQNLKIQVQNLGTVSIDLSCYLKPNIVLTTKCPFDHFQGFFEIFSKSNKAVGSLQLQFCSTFNPEIAIRQLGEQVVKQKKCEADKLNQKEYCECSGMCKCKMDKIVALDVIAVEKPDLFRQFYQQIKPKATPKKIQQKQRILNQDFRIPNSLNCQPNKSPFDPLKYADSSPIANKVPSTFPNVEKILTYSNLKLKKEETVQSKKNENIQIKKEVNLQQKQPLQDKLDLNSKQKYPLIIENKMSNKVNSALEQVKNYNYQQKKQEVFKVQSKIESSLPNQMMIKQNDPLLNINKQQISLSKVSQVKQVDDSESVELQKNILSRVVNLNEELEKQIKFSPKKEKIFDKDTNLIKAFEVKKNQHQNQVLSQRFINQKRKGSNLLMTMIFQINRNSIRLSKDCKFYINYRPYGQKQHLKIGPHLENIVTLMFPVCQTQISKMGKIPFILQFWNALNNELLGVIKLSLVKIYKGFMLQGRLNEVAIKTSLLPTVIWKGEIPITTILDQPNGQCHLQAHIGTIQQIQSYLNSPKTVEVAQVCRGQQRQQNKSISIKQQNSKQIQKKGTIIDLTQLLHLIDTNTTVQSVNSLMNFMSLKKCTLDQFLELLKALKYKGHNIFELLAYSDTMQCQELALCYNDYRSVKEEINKTMQKEVYKIDKINLLNIQKKIRNISKFGMVSKKEMNEILGSECNILSIQQFLPEILQVDSFERWLQSRGKIPLKQLFLIHNQLLFETIIDLFFIYCPNCLQQMQELISESKGSAIISFQTIRQKIVKNDGLLMSRWFWLLLLNKVYRKYGQQGQGDSLEIKSTLFYNWLSVQLLKQNELKIQKNEKQITQIKQQNEEKARQKSQQNISKDGIFQKSEINKNSQRLKQIQISEKSAGPKILEDMKKQKNQPKETIAQQKQTNLFDHKFTVSLQQFHISQDEQGECLVTYKFPFEQQIISSKRIVLSRNKFKYKIQSQGVHKITIKESIQQYLGESTLTIRVSINSNRHLYGDIHPDDLIAQGVVSKVIPLFCTDQDGMAGKIMMKCQYETRKSKEIGLSRETIQDVFLPKNGFINYQISTCVQESKLRQQFNIKQDFYVQLVLDIFGQNSALAPHYPIISSSLYSDLTSTLTVSGSYKITLNPQILNHLRGGIWNAKLIMVYYEKQRGNYQKKEIEIACLKAPLLSAIRQQGIIGDYAFKNKIGMFVCLAHSKIKYEKISRNKSINDQHLNDNSRQSYWIVLDFSQLLNYQGDLGFIKFQIIQHGKRYTTQKTLIKNKGFYNLQHKCLTLQVNDQQFNSIRILPVSIVTSSKRFGIDINLRPLASTIAKQKYAVDSYYFIAVNEQSRASKLRIGAKVYILRGNAGLGGFVEALASNTIRSNIQIVQRDDDYANLIEGLRDQLKLSKKYIDESLNTLVDRRKKEKINRQFFTSSIAPLLDLSPIIAKSSVDVDAIGQQLPSEIQSEQLKDYLKENGIYLSNLRDDLLSRYQFCKLNATKLDQNIEYLGLHDQIDLLVLLRKIKIQNISTKKQSLHQQELKKKSQVIRISIIKGHNFNLLYNGINPNSLVKLPEFGIQTEVIERTSDPIFNQNYKIDQDFSHIRKILVQAFHVPSDVSDEIMIGEGELSLNESFKNTAAPNSRVYRVLLTSVMSSRMQASLQVKIQLGSTFDRIEAVDNEYQGQQSVGDSVIEQAVQRVKRTVGHQRNKLLFESSEDEY